MFFIKKLLLFFILVFSSLNVFASDTNVSNQIKYSTSSSKGTYAGDEIYLGGYNGQFTVNTRYNGRLSMVSFYLSTSDYNFQTNHTYTITLNMATEDWRNNFMGPQVINAQSNGSLGSSLSVSNFRFVSKKQIKFNFKTSGTLNPYIFFRVYSTDYANTNSIAITGVNNWNLSSIYINDNVASTPTPAPVTPAPTATPQPNNQDIINNANQNTQDIINNANQNNQDIINNANQNTTDIIDNNNQNTQDIINNANQNAVCPTGPLTINENHIMGLGWLNSSGVVGSSTTDFVSRFFVVKPNTEYTLTFYGASSSTSSYCFYNGSKSLLSCSVYGGNSTVRFTTPSYVTYLRFTIPNYRTITLEGPVCNNWEQEATQDITNTMKDDNVDDKTSFFTNFENDNHGLTGIITLPLTTIQSLTNSSCVSLSIPIPFTNNNVTLPCMTQVYSTYIPSVYNIWQVVSFGIISYFICLDIFKMVKGFKDPNEDKIEVLDL